MPGEAPSPKRLCSRSAPLRAPVAPVTAATPEQAACVRLVVESGQNVFISGSAGTGKSFVLREILKAMPAEGLYVTASTGIAALNVGGTTVHSFAGIGLAQGTVPEILADVRRKSQVVRRWRKARCLVIDEISMISGSLFDLLNTVAQTIRGNTEPFGGIQLVVVGDFLQLPPVNAGTEREYAFEAYTWPQTIQHTVILRTVMRQRGDERLIAVLEQLREGRITPLVTETLVECNRPLVYADGVLPTRLYCINKDVNAENLLELRKLPGESMFCQARDSGATTEQLDRETPAQAVIELKVGAQVVLICNLGAGGLVNGSRGVVSGFASSGVPVVAFANGVVCPIAPNTWTITTEGRRRSREQTPLKLAWAITIHRAQGMSLDRVQCVLGNAWAPSQCYVALSRVTSLAGLQLPLGFDPRRVHVCDRVLAFYQALSGAR